jgi:hypothetical protein
MSEKLAENIDLCSESKLHWDGALFEAMLTRETETPCTMSALEIYSFRV